MTRFLLVCLGGAIGTATRYLVALGSLGAFGAALPYGTLIVNLAGSFLMAFVMQLAAATHWLSDDVRIMLATGVMGGFTTYSAFNWETTEMFRGGAVTTALLYVGATIFGCLIAGLLGLVAARLVTP
jgi:CrcB protein